MNSGIGVSQPVFAAYFTRAVAASPEEGTAAWGTANSLSALFVAVLSPVATGPEIDRKQAVEEIRALRRHVTTGGTSVRAMIEERTG